MDNILTHLKSKQEVLAFAGLNGYREAGTTKLVNRWEELQVETPEVIETDEDDEAIDTDEY